MLGNDSWEDRFPTTLVQFMDEGEYDHTPMLISFSPPNHSKKSFRFFNNWTQKENFLEVIRDHWHLEVQVYVSYQIMQS